MGILSAIFGPSDPAVQVSRAEAEAFIGYCLAREFMASMPMETLKGMILADFARRAMAGEVSGNEIEGFSNAIGRLGHEVGRNELRAIPSGIPHLSGEIDWWPHGRH